MLKKAIDKLIFMHFRGAGSVHRLDSLESDVWKRIHSINIDKALSWQEKMFLAFGVPQFRFASITLALLLGLGVGSIMPQVQLTVASKEIGLHVFAANVEYLPSTLFEGK